MSDTDRINARLQEALRMKAAHQRNANAEGLVSNDWDPRTMMEKVPIADLLNQIQQLENQILPKMAEVRGKDHADYKMWYGVLNSLRWAIWLNDRVFQLEVSMSRLMHFSNYTKTLNAKLERELTRYTTMEQFLQTDTMNDYMAAAAKAAESKLL